MKETPEQLLMPVVMNP